MSQDLPTNPLSKSIHRLTIAAWAIALMLLAHLLLNALPIFFPKLYAEEILETFNAMEFGKADSSRPVIPQKSDVQPLVAFHELPLDEQIKQASVIALTRYEKAENGKVRQVISELLKRDPTATFSYEVGDEYASRYENPDINYGDGMIMFFKGPSARIVYSASFADDRAYGLEDIPLALLREKCKQAAAKP